MIPTYTHSLGHSKNPMLSHHNNRPRQPVGPQHNKQQIHKNICRESIYAHSECKNDAARPRGEVKIPFDPGVSPRSRPHVPILNHVPRIPIRSPHG